MIDKIKDILLQVERPSRYVGGEYNLPNMDKPCKERICLCFPDKYEIGMSNIGTRILYHMINDMNDFVCERCYAPDLDMSNLLKKNNVSLFSIETKKDLKLFDAVGFSVQFELQLTNICYMLDLASIPFYSEDRDESFPIVFAGGSCVANPMPFAKFFDAILIGDGEKNLKEFVELHLVCKEQGLSKKEFLKRATLLDGVYVPSLKNPTKRAVLQDLDKGYFPTKILVPNCEIVHDRAVLELFRGCANGCRFCQACFFYRPIRERKVDTLTKQAIQLLDSTGYDELSMSSLSTSDYSCLKQLVANIKEVSDKRKVKLALPSLRLDSFEAEIYEETNGKSLTFAPEAGTQRLRDVINKNISDDDIVNSLKQSLMHGVKNIKLYFMIGLPSETQEDIEGIVKIAKLVKNLHRDFGSSKIINIVVSTSVFIPKPITPFQWERQISMQEMIDKQKYLKENLKLKNVKYNWHGAESSVIEAVFSRGDKRLADVVVAAYKNGCIFDSWSENFDFAKWKSSFESCGVDICDYTKEFDENFEFEWDIIDNGVTKQYLLEEKHKSEKCDTTPSCIGKCNGCGANRLGRCFE